jgi:hypothetical protein
MYEYKSQEELYQGLIPALNVKMKQLKKNNIKDITKEDIWNYLKETKWKNSIDLTLADMVEDIIHSDNSEIISYKNKNKKAIFN